MRKLQTIVLLVMLASFNSSKVYSQSTVPADSIKSMLINEWQRAKDYTQDYMNVMPANKYSFKATDSVRSFAQQLLHLAQANMFFTSIATGAQLGNSPDLEKSASAQSADSVKYYVNNSYDHVINALKNISVSTLMQPASFNMGRTITATRLGWFLKAFEHQTHHRGQTTIYLRLAGVRPPQERLF